MIAIELDSKQQSQLNALAAAQGQDGVTLARRVLLEYLEFQALPADSDDTWANASVELTPEFMSDEKWDEPQHGPQ